MADPGVLMKGLLDVRSRLEKVTKTKEGRGKLVERIIKADEEVSRQEIPPTDSKPALVDHEVPDLSVIDKRLGQLESLVGASGTTLDEVCKFIQPASVYRREPLVLTAPSATPSSRHSPQQSIDVTDTTTTHRLDLSPS